jgi:iron complex transport system permease protein
MDPVSRWRRWALLVAAACGLFGLSLLTGSTPTGPADLFAALRNTADPTVQAVIFDLRLPRVLAAFGVGSSLAVAGLLLQALFRNPLADPYVLGVSGGAAVGALLAMTLGTGLAVVQGSALAGSCGAIALVYLLGRGAGTDRLLLTGVVIAAACGAVVTLLLAIATGDQLRGMVFWLAGDLSLVRSAWPALAAAAVAGTAAALVGRSLNVLAAGELRALAVGLDTRRWRAAVIGTAAVLTTIAVATAGTIGFVGLVGPHSARLLLRTADHRLLAPAAALLGGCFVAASDLVARTIVEPRQLPVGGIMALIGAPVFVALLRRAAR